MFADTNESETIFAPVIQAGMEALKVRMFLSIEVRIRLDKLQKFHLLKASPKSPTNHNGK